ncbi:NAD(P)H-hydrate dehydratase [Sedimentitalea sp. JM2-8]|uniref:Bifunctional NAD(P)H-hydrate repair enzyme n=1 Tax=Sedimentitalea xiamensis TaxID=3050037 RepID=A0ABT7FCG4_9RHOB|nr:NAD(P)H-hydrate dehydratase [Sedimentitalea xiamensis]MDK3072806.1 NAD(P)H-hydrate dehydratase [Sedimentitalea xiamensis]
MAELLTAAEMRAVERDAIASGIVTGLELMERAGAGVVDAIFEEWPDLAQGSHKAVVLCGPGNNGGDGFVVARLLQQRGWTVTAHLMGEADRLPPDARTNHDLWIGMGPCLPLSDGSLGSVKSLPDLVVDALFGTGLARPVEGDAEFLLGNLDTLRRDFGVRSVAVDIPSGICSDSGKALGCFPKVDLTVSFHSEKLGHRLEQADTHSRRVVVKDIGLHHFDPEDERHDHVWCVEPPAADLLDKPVSGQKYTQGHALVLTGGAGRTGAARLAAMAALRVGAGLVTLGVPQSAMSEVANQITALMMIKVPDAETLGELLWDTRLNALCLGPGLGLTDLPRSLIATVLPLRRPVVLDADALSMFHKTPAELFDMLHEKAVLTPHRGEFARLFPDLDQKLKQEPQKGPAYSKVDAVRAAARRAGCTVLLKGADTVMAAPDGRCSIHSAQYDRAAPWLATAGSGDVLSGMITGLMARGLAPLTACETASWLHTQCALMFGPGLIAEDIASQIPAVLRDRGIRTPSAG